MNIGASITGVGTSNEYMYFQQCLVMSVILAAALHSNVNMSHATMRQGIWYHIWLHPKHKIIDGRRKAVFLSVMI